jgi:phage terminase large subunit
MLEGAVYAEELRKTKEDGRLCNVPYDPTQPVQTFWDLGWADCTSIWFAQTVGFELRVIDFYQSQLQALPHYLKMLQEKPYIYKNHWLPHDAAAKSLGTGKSIEELVRAAGHKCSIVPKLAVTDGINAARTIFPQCYFDATKTADGINALRHYRYDVDPDTGKFGRSPLHDHNSHAADAFRYFAVAIKQPKQNHPRHDIRHRPAGGGWQSM